MRHGQLFEHVDYLSRRAKLKTSKLQGFGKWTSCCFCFSRFMAIQRDVYCLTPDITAPVHSIFVLVDFRNGSEIRHFFDRHARHTASLFVLLIFGLFRTKSSVFLHMVRIFSGDTKCRFCAIVFPQFVKRNWHGYCSWKCKFTRCWPFVYSDFYCVSQG